MNLARLRRNFSDADVGEEGYFKIEQALADEELSPLHATFPTMEQKAMLQAAFNIVHFYRQLAPPLAQAHGIEYPEALERVMVKKLEKLQSDLTM